MIAGACYETTADLSILRRSVNRLHAELCVPFPASGSNARGERWFSTAQTGFIGNRALCMIITPMIAGLMVEPLLEHRAVGCGC